METLTYINLNVHENPEKQFQLWPLLKNRKIQWLNTFANVKQGIYKNLHKSFPPNFFLTYYVFENFTEIYKNLQKSLVQTAPFCTRNGLWMSRPWHVMHSTFFLFCCVKNQLRANEKIISPRSKHLLSESSNFICKFFQ